MKFHLLAAAALSALLLGTVAHAQTAAPAAAPTPAITAPATTAPAANAPATAAPAPAPAARPATTATRPAATATTGGTQFKTEAEAKAHCPSDTVVWANKETKVYHLSGSRYYGKTKVGAYMCQKEADAAKFHAARARRPAAAAAGTASGSTATQH